MKFVVATGLCLFVLVANVWGASELSEIITSYDKCTAMAVGKSASKTGSPMTTHTADCAECDWRVNKVPSQDWPAGAMRPIYLLSGAYPRQVREDRGQTWSKANLEQGMPQLEKWHALENKTIIGYIPQVAHTYALIEGLYGIMNEHNVAIGESTCGAKLFAAPVSAGGKALLEASELSQIALERAKTAREAILIMGTLAEQYGFYSAEWNVNNPYGLGLVLGEGGEALTVVDTEEAWMFHIIPDDTGASAIWVAQRVPDNHIAAVANNFVIREVIPNHPDFLYSANLWLIAERLGWYDASRDGPLLNFVHTYAPKRVRSNYAHRRVWRIFTVANKHLTLPMETNTYADDYPFSVEVKFTEKDHRMGVQDLIDLQRDHFEQTPLSTGYGSLAGGPYGDPNRFDVSDTPDMTIMQALQGEFPRTISLFRTSYSFVAEPRKGEVGSVFPRMWFGQYAPDQSTFVPLYVLAQQLPSSWIRGTMQKYDSSVAFWNFCAAGNYASRFYIYAMEAVRALQRRLENELVQQVNAMESQLLAGMKSAQDKNQYLKDVVEKTVTSKVVSLGNYVTDQWRELLPQLITTYRDGYIIGGQTDTYVEIHRLFYPKWWLEKVGYFGNNGTKDALNDPSAIYFAPNPAAMSSSILVVSWVLNTCLTILIAGALGFYMGARYKQQQATAGTESHNGLQMSSFSSPLSRSKLVLGSGRNSLHQNGDVEMMDDEKVSFINPTTKTVTTTTRPVSELQAKFQEFEAKRSSKKASRQQMSQDSTHSYQSI